MRHRDWFGFITSCAVDRLASPIAAIGNLVPERLSIIHKFGKIVSDKVIDCAFYLRWFE